MQDSWGVTDRLALELGLRYGFYSVVNEKNDLAKPFFVEDNAFSKDSRFAANQGVQVRVQHRQPLNYEAPAATLPNGTPGTDLTALLVLKNLTAQPTCNVQGATCAC